MRNIDRMIRMETIKYKTILADPPWNERGGGKCKRGADKHYNLMTSNEIIEYFKVNIVPITHNNCHLYLWVTNNYLETGLRLINECGFRYITNLVWLKDKFGLGQYYRGKHELCLFAVKGAFVSNSKKETTEIKGKRTRHSQKPYDIYRKIEAVSDKPMLEVFSRNKRQDWEAIGNQLTNETQKLLLTE